MTTFLENLWNSVFTPGTTPTLLLATNASFGALQLLLFILLLATHSIHFIILSVLTASLWWAINWFARELALENARVKAEAERGGAAREIGRTKREREKSPSSGSETETELIPSDARGVEVLMPQQLESARSHLASVVSPSTSATGTGSTVDSPNRLAAQQSDSALKRRNHTDSHAGDSNGYASTDSEWEKISDHSDGTRTTKTT